MNTKLLLLALLLAGFMAAAGCGGDDSLVGEPVTNSAPETQVTATPPVLGQTEFTVDFFWTGADKDGEVVFFEWRISNNGADGVVDVEDTLEVNLPWHRTTVTDSSFVVSAEIDSFGVDVEDPNQDPSTYRFWQTHTFFIRAVDEKGARDPSPARVSFTATTLAPTIFIDLPDYLPNITCNSASKVLTFGWSGSDPDNIEGDPAEVRYILLPVGSASDACYTRDQFQTISPIHNDDPLWSGWIPYDAPNDSGRVVTLDRQEVGDKFLFAVQARDVAGAVTPTFEWGVNVRHVKITSNKFPLLTVTERFLGGEGFVSTNELKGFEIVSGQPLEFEWNADATEYAGIVEAFRYGWNLVDPDDPNDPGWAVSWGNGPNWRRALPRSFTQGSPNFVVQCRDNSGTISRGFYQFQVIQITQRPNQRDLLFIDDWLLGDSDAERDLNARFARQWDEVLSPATRFDTQDVFDAAQDADRLGFGLINEYKSVIWFTNASALSYYHTRLAPIGRLEPRYNWVEVYQARVGNLLFVGPGVAYNSVERDPPNWQFPIVFNVSAGGDLGFGTDRNPDGTTFNVGTIRWPYTAWCLESVDLVRPAWGQVFGEGTGVNARRRTMDCDGLLEAAVTTEFLSRYAGAEAQVGNLRPVTPYRINQSPEYKLNFEEFYNRNVTVRDVSLILRDCQTPMFEYRARRDDNEGVWLDPEVLTYVAYSDSLCFPKGLDASTLDAAPVGIVSHVYSESKQLRGSEDFLWGFHPLAFELRDIRNAIAWILENRWELEVNTSQ